jgi:hypothetical protein
MKSIKHIREQFDLVTEKEENSERKLTTLVRSGLVDANKLPLIKRALNKDNRVLTPSERNALMTLLDSLMAQVLSNNPVYQKVKQNVMKEDLKPAATRMSDMPSILILKRKAIRVYPDRTNVGLYYSQQLDRYVAVPFGGAKMDKNVLSMTEEVQLDEISDELRNATYAKRVVAVRRAKPNSKESRKHLKKAAATGVRTIAKGAKGSSIEKGISDWEDMQSFADKYDDVEKSTQARFKATYNKKKQQKVGKKSVKKAKTPEPVSEPSTTPPTKPAERSRTKVSPEFKNGVDMSVMKSTAAQDFVKHRSLMHTVGGIGYRMLNKRKIQEEQQIDEALPLIPVAGAVAGAVGRSVAGRAIAGAATKYGSRIAGAVKNAIKGKGKSSGKRPSAKDIKKKRLDKIDKNRSRNARVNNRKNDLAASTNSGGSSSSSGASGSNSVMGTSPTGGPSKMHIRTSSSIVNDYNRKNARAMMQPMRESVDLDGNKFELNSNVAKKLTHVYESLNKTNKKKMIKMLNESEESFNKVISFVVRH